MNIKKKTARMPRAMREPITLATTVEKKRMLGEDQITQAKFVFGNYISYWKKVADSYMDILTDYEIPYLHPLVVHFPIAFFVGAVIVVMIWALTDSGRWFVAFASMQILGTVGAIAAFLSGEAIEDATEDVPIVDLLVGQHERMGKFVLILAILISIVTLAVAYVYRKRSNYDGIPMLFRALLAVLAVILVALTAYTAHIGGVMVWGIPTG